MRAAFHLNRRRAGFLALCVDEFLFELLRHTNGRDRQNQNQW